MRYYLSLVLVFTIVFFAIACGEKDNVSSGRETNIDFSVKDETYSISSSDQWLLCMHEVNNPTKRYCDLAAGNPRKVSFGKIDAGTYVCHAEKSNDATGNSNDHNSGNTVTIKDGDNKTILFTFYVAGYYNSPLGVIVPIREWKFEVINN